MSIGGERLNMTNVSHVELNGQTATPAYMENGRYLYMSYNTDNNSQEGGDFRTYNDEIYFNPFVGHIPLGEQVATLVMKDGRTVDLPFEVMSHRVMPTVAAKTYYTDFVVVASSKDKSGKKIKATALVKEVDNLTARELDGQLIIQFAEPDGAFQAPLPGTSGIRLRIWVGDMGSMAAPSELITFLFIDAPVATGTLVVPADKWNTIKAEMVAVGRTTVTIGGMYREQFEWFHNRGYLENIEYTF
jgi:hypothetical protein